MAATPLIIDNNEDDDDVLFVEDGPDGEKVDVVPFEVLMEEMDNESYWAMEDTPIPTSTRQCALNLDDIEDDDCSFYFRPDSKGGFEYNRAAMFRQLSAIEDSPTPDGDSDPDDIMVLHPYKLGSAWVFDDPEKGLKHEAFVSGIDKIIDFMTADLDGAEEGFELIFSAKPFPDHDIHITWDNGKWGGNWYFSPKHKMLGWLCPALLKYFQNAPAIIYAAAQ